MLNELNISILKCSFRKLSNLEIFLCCCFFSFIYVENTEKRQFCIRTIYSKSKRSLKRNDNELTRDQMSKTNARQTTCS